MMEETGYNKDNEIHLGVVKSIEPIVIDLGHLVLEQDDFFICNNLLKHKRKYKLLSPRKRDYQLMNPPSISPKNCGPYCNGEHIGTSDVYPGGYLYTMHEVEDYTYEIEFEGILQPNDKVIVFQDNNDFYVIDKAVDLA